MTELRNCWLECQQARRIVWPEAPRDCNQYPHPPDINVSVSGEGCTSSEEETIRSNYLACLNAKKAAWFPIIQKHCEKWNEITGEIYYTDQELAEEEVQLCIAKCERDNCLTQAWES